MELSQATIFCNTTVISAVNLIESSDTIVIATIIKQAIFEAIEQRLKPYTKDVLQYIQQLARTQKLSATKSPTDDSSLWQNL